MSKPNMPKPSMPTPNICPLCGENNLCAIAADSKAGDCWCKQQVFSADVIKQAQQNQQAQQCICQPCAQKALRLAINAD